MTMKKVKNEVSKYSQPTRRPTEAGRNIVFLNIVSIVSAEGVGGKGNLPTSKITSSDYSSLLCEMPVLERLKSALRILGGRGEHVPLGMKRRKKKSKPGGAAENL